MQIGSTGSEQVARSAQAMNDILKMAVDSNQELSGKLVKMTAEQKVSQAQQENTVDFRA